jgi:hypothetical protein
VGLEDKMPLKAFTVGCSRTINLGNFESTRLEASVTIEVEDISTLENLKAGAQAQLRDLLEQTWQTMKPKKEQQ